MKRLVIIIVLAILAVALSGCVAVSGYGRMRHSIFTGYSRHVFVRPGCPPAHHAPHGMHGSRHPRFRH